MMFPYRCQLRIGYLPEAEDPLLAQMVGGNVRHANLETAASLMNLVAVQMAGSCSVGYHLQFDPHEPNITQRLSCRLDIGGAGSELVEQLRQRVMNSPWAQLHNLRPEDSPVLPDFTPMAAACAIVRLEQAIEPVLDRDLNSNRPPRYYLCLPWFPRQPAETCLALAGGLIGLGQPVLVDYRYQPADPTILRSALARYRAALRSAAWPETREDSPLFDVSAAVLPPTVLPMARREPMADDAERQLRAVHEALGRDSLQFHVIVLSTSAAAAQFVASIVAEGALAEGQYRLLTYDSTHRQFADCLQAVRHRRVVLMDSLSEVLKEHAEAYAPLRTLSQTAPVSELAGMMSLPVAPRQSVGCIRKNTDSAPIRPEDQVRIGSESGGPEATPGDGRTVAMDQRTLCKHVFVSGMPGGGKTTWLLGLLMQLLQRCVPWIVFECAKREYRRLVSCARRLGRQVQIWTPGNPACSPYQLNMLTVPPGRNRDAHIDTVAHCFQAGFSSEEPLPQLFIESVECAYSMADAEARCPTMADVVRAIPEVLARKGYTPEVESNLRAALETRLRFFTHRTLGHVFQCSQSIPPIDQLINGHTIVELDALSDPTKSLLILFILQAVHQRLQVQGAHGGGPKLVIVLEEASAVVGAPRTTSSGPGQAPDPRPVAAEFVARLLAEIRALGGCVMVSSQHPSVVAEQVAKSTASKIAFRQVDREDREILASAMLLNPTEYEHLPRLRPGEAYWFADGDQRPRLLKTIDWEQELGLGPPPDDRTLRQMIERENWFRETLVMRLGDLAQRSKEAMDGFDQMMHRYRANIRAVMESGASGPGHLSMCRRRLIEVRRQLDRAVAGLRQGVVTGLQEEDVTILRDHAEAQTLLALRQTLLERYQNVLLRHAARLRALLEKLAGPDAWDQP